MSELDQVVSEFLKKYQAAWSDNSASRIEAAWDTDNPPFYKAEEIERILTSWEDVRAYWKHNETFNSINELSYSDIYTHSLSDDVALIGMRMRWDIQFSKDAKELDGHAFAYAGQTMGGDNHVMACMKKLPDDWKLSAWVEAPDAPILYMAQLYRQNVRPDFIANR
jgi:hypothetical protein